MNTEQANFAGLVVPTDGSAGTVDEYCRFVSLS
jgi:hypothetical protein